jgi:hypothetical protein
MIIEMNPGEMVSIHADLREHNLEVGALCTQRRILHQEILIPLEDELKIFQQLHQDKVSYWKEEFKCILRG